VGFGFTAIVTDAVDFTDCETDTEDAAWVESPPYAAPIVWFPCVRAEVESVAVPEASVAVPKDVPPSKNCTVPVEAAGVTVAVNVTLCPVVDGFALDVMVVVVAV
jgi:hypothetical protein